MRLSGNSSVSVPSLWKKENSSVILSEVTISVHSYKGSKITDPRNGGWEGGVP